MGAPYVATQSLRFCDTDALGHVNNAVYAQMLEVGRAELMHRAGLLNQNGVGVVIVRLELDFIKEMVWPGFVRIETAITRIGAKSMDMRQRLLLGGAITARGLSVLAVIDAQTRRAVPIAEEWKARLDPWVMPEFMHISTTTRLA